MPSFRPRTLRYFLVLLLTLSVPSVFAKTSRSSDHSHPRTNTFPAIPLLPVWRAVGKIPLQFDAFHTQGLVKIGSNFYISSVEVQQKTKSASASKTGFNKTAGQGVAHLFQVDEQGKIVNQITLGEETMYHPGGMDYDGESIWVPVSEYRPKSLSIIYKVDPTTLKAVEAFRVMDHIGGVVFNRELKTLVGLNWGSDFFYEWTPEGRVLRKVKNEIGDIQYQDCKYVQGPAMVCGGVLGNAEGRLDLIDLFDFSRIRGLWSIPRTSGKILMTRNPMTLEQQDNGRILYYFLPEDHFGTIYIYELG